MNNVIKTMPEIPRVVESIFSRFMTDMKTLIPEFQKEANQDCKWSWLLNADGTHVIRNNAYMREVPISKHWEEVSTYYFQKTLESIGSKVIPKGLLSMSDRNYHFEYEGAPLIVCADAKVSKEKGEHIPHPKGLKIHIGINQCPDSILGCTRLKQPQYGRQLSEKNGVKILCFDLFVNYDFNEDFTYTIKHYGIAWIPYETGFDIQGYGAKSDPEMRMRLKDPRLFRIHSLAFESDPQTQGSTPSDNIEHQVAELPTQ
jgi:hypothetical protein